MKLAERKIPNSSVQRVWNVLKTELAPYPGRFSLVARIVLASVIMMLLIMIFRIPGAALGAYYPLLLSRDSPRATMKSAKLTGAICILGTIEVILGAMLLAASPFTHFLWVGANLFLIFYLISGLQVYDTALALGLLLANAITTWDQPMSSDMKVKQTLFTLLTVLMGCVISVTIEYLFASTHPPDRILVAIEARLIAIQRLMQGYADSREAEPALLIEVHRYATRGTGELRELLSHSNYDDDYKERIAAALALSSRLTELADALHRLQPKFTDEECAQCSTIAGNIARINDSLLREESPDWIDIPTSVALSNSILAELERTVDLIAQSLGSSDRSIHYHLPEPGEAKPTRLFVEDLRTSKAHIKFAIRGTLSALACYLVYMSLGWTGLSASIATCILTALTTTGAARHKQLMRFAGVILGACIIGFGFQAVILPGIDSLFAFTLVFGVVIALGAWISASGPRIAYCGAQMILAYDLVNLNRFAINTSLVPARDVVLGIALGIVAMWLIFDHLWATPVTDTVYSIFLSSLYRVHALFETNEFSEETLSVQKFQSECRAISRNFDKARTMLDFLLFEAFPKTADDIYVEQCVRLLQPQLRSFLLLMSGLRQHQTASSQPTTENLSRLARRSASEAMSSLIKAFREPHQAVAISVDETMSSLASKVRETIERSIPSADQRETADLRFSLALLELSYSLRSSIPYVAATAAAFLEDSPITSLLPEAN